MIKSKLKNRNLSQEDVFNFSELFKLMKPRVMSLVIFTCAVGLLMAPNIIPIIASLVGTMFGAINKPTAQVKITNDITLGFISLKSSEKLKTSSWLKFLFFNLDLIINSWFKKSKLIIS